MSSQAGLEMRESRLEEVLHWRRSESGLLRVFVDHLKLIPSLRSLAEHGDELFLHLSTHLGGWARVRQLEASPGESVAKS